MLNCWRERVSQGSVERRYLVRTCWPKSSGDFKSPRWEAEVKLGRSIPTQELNAEFTPVPRPGWKTHPVKKHAGAALVTPKSGIYHHIEDDKFNRPEPPQRTGRVPALSGADVTHRGESIAFMVTTSSRYVSMNQHEPPGHRCVSEVVVEPTRVTGIDKLEEIDHGITLERQVDVERRLRKVGMGLTATLLFTFAQLFQEWNRSNTVHPYPVA